MKKVNLDNYNLRHQCITFFWELVFFSPAKYSVEQQYRQPGCEARPRLGGQVMRTQDWLLPTPCGRIFLGESSHSSQGCFLICEMKELILE